MRIVNSSSSSCCYCCCCCLQIAATVHWLLEGLLLDFKMKLNKMWKDLWLWVAKFIEAWCGKLCMTSKQVALDLLATTAWMKVLHTRIVDERCSRYSHTITNILLYNKRWDSHTQINRLHLSVHGNFNLYAKIYIIRVAKI